MANIKKKVFFLRIHLVLYDNYLQCN